MGNKNQSLSWEDFKKMGNPENAPDLPLDEDQEEDPIDKSVRVRIGLEKKGRNGKEVSIIRGLELYDNEMNDLAKRIKKACGVGGSAKDGEIIIQGNHRKKILEILKSEGYKDVKIG